MKYLDRHDEIFQSEKVLEFEDVPANKSPHSQRSLEMRFSVIFVFVNPIGCGQNFHVNCLTAKLLVNPAKWTLTNRDKKHIVIDVNKLAFLKSMSTI